MAKGRKRTPDHLKVVSGTYRPDRANPDAPDAAKERPQPPAWLDESAGAWFELLADRIEGLGLASSTYTEALALAAARMAEIEECNEAIATYGRVYETKTTNGDKAVKNNPAVAQRNEAMRHLQSLLAEFGLTPASIGKVANPNQSNDKNRFSDFA